MEFLRNVTNLAWICLPGAEKTPVSYECEGMLLHLAAEEMLAKAGLAYRNFGGELIVGHPESLEARAAKRKDPLVLPSWRPDEPRWSAEIRRSLDTTVAVDFAGSGSGRAPTR